MKKRTLISPIITMTIFRKILSFLIILSLFTIENTLAQSNAEKRITVSGKITDTKGEAIIGASIIVKGTSIGSITNIDGNFSINNVSCNAVLQFSFIGMKPEVVPIEGKSIINIVLKDDAVTMEDVQVVAFGTQKKGSIVSSITTIKPSELRIPSSNLTTALAGNVAGIISYQRSGEPGNDNADFFVRGATSFGYKVSPLILIDGVELGSSDLARLSVDDISSFSIMKDASATALYGARGANGVILVTTKTGKSEKVKVSVRLENSFSQPTQNVKFADPITYMKLSNEAILTRDPLGMTDYTDEQIDNTVLGSSSIQYPINDWQKLCFKDNTMNQRTNINMTGGGTVARYYVSGTFSQDNGVLNVDKRNNFNSNIDLKKYSVRSNINLDVTKSTEVILRLTANFDEYSGPPLGDANTSPGTDLYNRVVKSVPTMFPAYFPDETLKSTHILFGNGVDNKFRNPYADMSKGYKQYSKTGIIAQLEIKQNLESILKGLKWRAMVSTTRGTYFAVERTYSPFYYRLAAMDPQTNKPILQSLNVGTEYLGYSEEPKIVSSDVYAETALNYDRIFAKKHDVSLLLVGIAKQRLEGNATDLLRSLPYRNLGISGRASYGFDKRYYLEFNFGYNGSERFDQQHRFGFFPSIGFAWSVENEKFWENLKQTINKLRIKGTYGVVGNDAIGTASDRFFYLSNVDLNYSGKSATFGTDFNKTIAGVNVSRYANPDITWEVSTKKNLTLELGFLEKFTFIGEYYSDFRENILMNRVLPLSAGLSSTPRTNVGKASGSGVDLSLDYQQHFKKDFWLTTRANLTFAKSKYEVVEEMNYPGEPWRSMVGRPLNQTMGYIAERLFIDDEEVANSPKQFGTVRGGDIKYTDVNRDGEITSADLVPIGYPTVPELVYGFGFSLGYKNFDISAFFQGTARESFSINVAQTAPFQDQTQLLEVYADSHWSENNRDLYAVWPRLSYTLNSNNNQPSTWFMRDGGFLRVKQIEIGYNLPKSIQKSLHTSNLRLYVNGSNLLTFSKFGWWDPEMAGNGLGYPIQRVINVGLNISFN